MNSNTITEELIATARRRLDSCNALLKHADEQRDILRTNQHSLLPDNLAEFDRLLLQVQNLEKHERSLCERLEQAGESGLTQTGSEYATIRAGIAEAGQSLHNIMEVNKRLLSTHMDYVSFSLGLIFRFATEHSSANASSNPALMLDSKV